MSDAKFINFNFIERSESEMLVQSKTFNSELQKRRTIRDFSTKPVSLEIINQCLLAAGSSPSGANKQPWKFVVITDKMLKTKIRYAAELVEQEFYEGKAPEEWINALAPIGTNKHKPFLEEAPVLITIFEEKYCLLPNGEISKNYYTRESVGIATGMLINAIHNCGLASLTHTPSPMGFLNKILDRPENERPFLILVVGYPKPNTQVPDIKRKALEEMAIYK